MIENPEFDPLGAGDANDVIYTAAIRYSKGDEGSDLMPQNTVTDSVISKFSEHEESKGYATSLTLRRQLDLKRRNTIAWVHEKRSNKDTDNFLSR
jgi:hypothetical protein